MKKIFRKIFLKTLDIKELPDADLKFLYKKFNKEIRQYFIEQELPMFSINKKDIKIQEHLSELYQSEDYKMLTHLLCNYKNRLGSRLMRVDSTEIHRKQDSDGVTVNVNKFSDSYWRGFFDGQAKFISYLLTLVRSVHIKYVRDNKDKDGDK